MASSAVIDAIETYLAANWNLLPVVGIKTPDVTASDAGILAVQYPVANSSQITIGAPGANVYRTEGAVRFVLQVDRHSSRMGAVQMADDLATLFRGKALGGVLTFAPGTPVFDDSNDDGMFYRLSFAVPYRHDLIRLTPKSEETSMAFASSSGARIARVAETEFGVTPDDPVFVTLRATGGGLRTTKATGVSNELRADRNVMDEFQLGQDVTGSYPIEMSYGSFDDLMEAALFGAWTTNVLKNGVARKSFTFEETLELGATDAFSRFTGVMVNTMALAIERRAAITGSFGLMGQKEELDEAIVDGATYTAAGTEPVLNASNHVTVLTLPGDITAKVSRLNVEVNNGLRTRPTVGSLYSEEFGEGRCEVTGTLECYFESNDLYEQVLAHGGGALSSTFGAATTKKYTLDLPKIIFLDGARQIGGNTDDVMVSIPFRAVYDATTGCSIRITRAVT